MKAHHILNLGTRRIMRPVRYLWETRRCWICDRFGNCGHREPEVDLAIVHAELRDELRNMVKAILMEKAS